MISSDYTAQHWTIIWASVDTDVVPPYWFGIVWFMHLNEEPSFHDLPVLHQFLEVWISPPTVTTSSTSRRERERTCVIAHCITVLLWWCGTDVNTCSSSLSINSELRRWRNVALKMRFVSGQTLTKCMHLHNVHNWLYMMSSQEYT